LTKQHKTRKSDSSVSLVKLIRRPSGVFSMKSKFELES